MKKLYILIIVLTSIGINGFSQGHLDYQLRLEPVWSRVADAYGEAGSVESVEFSPDGKYIVSGAKFDNSVIMWRTSDGAEIWRKYTGQEVERVGWSHDGQYVAAASEDFLVTVYHAQNGEVIHTFKHASGIDGLTWSHEQNLLVSGEEKSGEIGGFVRIFDISKGKEIKNLDFDATVNELFFSKDDEFLLAVGHGSVKVYRVEDWSLVQTLNPGYYVVFTSGAFSPNGQYVFAVGQGGTSRGNCYLWEWETGKLVKMFNQTGKKIESVTWHPSGDYIVYAGHDPYIHVYRLSEIIEYGNDAIPVAHKSWAGDHAEYLDFNTDGSFLCSAHQNGLIKLWVWMGEDPSLNSKRHSSVVKKQGNNN